MQNRTKYISLTILAILYMAAHLSHAQDALSKQDRRKVEKEWRKRQRSLEPLAFKQLVDDKDSAQRQVASLTAIVAAAHEKLKAAEEENLKLKSNLELASQTQPTAEGGMANEVTPSHHPVTAGVVFKVQIGAFRNKNLDKYLDNNPNFSGDTDQDGSRKYTIGLFKDYWEADTFKKYMREMGVADAWIVTYRDGRRVPIKDVLEGAVGMN